MRTVVTDLANQAHERADWRSVEHLYVQIAEIVRDSNLNIPPDAVVGHLAERMERISASYTGAEFEFVWHCLGVMAAPRSPRKRAGQAFRDLYRAKEFDRIAAYRLDAERRRPRPFEAVVETARRLRDLQAVRHAFEATASAAVLGGSASYGRFFNVRGDHGDGGSDVDLMLVLRSWSDSDALLQLSSVPGVDGAEVVRLKERMDAFHELRLRPELRDAAISFSHKLDLWSAFPDVDLPRGLTGRYRLSLHVVDLATFSQIIVEDAPILESDRRGYFKNPIHDYREDRPSSVHRQRSFDGREVSPEISLKPVRGGWLTARQACFVEHERYFPGFHQNLILPQFEVRWESAEVQLEYRLDAFRWKLIERLRHERTDRPFRVLRLSLSHTRSLDFAPHVVRKVDGG